MTITEKLSVEATQHRLLMQLLECKNGLTIDELAGLLDISRGAVKQHLSTLGRTGQVISTTSRKTGGRPSRVYVLTDAGVDLFPKKYSWFSRLLFENLRAQIGADAFADYMFELGVEMSATAIPRLVGKTRLERVAEIVKIMNETGFVARTVAPEEGDSLPRIECKNCVYHDLSKDYVEVCRFDIGFISGLMGSEVEHQECMQRGGQSCRFRLHPPA
jgi:DeoR family transcriptional regulator, suf operon transcriptional repressor